MKNFLSLFHSWDNLFSLTHFRYFSLFSLPLLPLSYFLSHSSSLFLYFSLTPSFSLSLASLPISSPSPPPSLFSSSPPPFFLFHLFSFSSFIFLYTCILLSPLLPNSSLFPFSVSHIKLSPRLSREHYITPGCLNLGTNIYQSYCIAARRGGRGAPGES